MIYIRGDTHGEPDCFRDPRLASLGQGDKLIITGDFGFVFRGGDACPEEKERLDALARLPYEILFVDGNHEGFDYLEVCPQLERYGAPVRQIRPNIFWLQRGYIYTVEGKTFFTMGGGYSLDKGWRLNFQRYYGDKIWFEQEMPTSDEYRRAIASLREHDMKVDCILTHTAPRLIIPRVIHQTPDPHEAELNGFLDWVYTEVDFKHWFFGHLHMDERLNDQMTACFEAIHLQEL